MTDPNFIILYVDDPAASAVFYAGLLGTSPLESSPTFAMFALASGIMLGLWSKHTVEPVSVADNHVVHALHAEWLQRGLVIIQAPTAMDFGYTFVATDPDGHRLRVFAPSVS